MKNTNNENLKNIESLIIKDSKLNLEKLLKFEKYREFNYKRQ